MLSILKNIVLMKNDEGATAIDYALIVSLIAVAALTALSTVSGKATNVLSGETTASPR